MGLETSVQMVEDNHNRDREFLGPAQTSRSIAECLQHTGGEPLRIPISGLPPINGNTVLEKRRYFMENYDYIRKALLLEPRGHADAYGAILTKCQDPKVDLDCIFLNTDGYSSMCGHGTLAITQVAFETGLVKKESPISRLTIAVPAGLVYATAHIATDLSITKTTFRNVPSFVYLRDQKLFVPELGIAVNFDISFGGVFYAIIDAQPLGLTLNSESYTEIIRYAQVIKKAIVSAIEVKHPYEKDLSGLFGVMFTSPAHDSKNHSRNVNVFEDGAVDRSACGSGVSARSALLFAKEELKMGEEISIESIIGSLMSVEVVEQVQFGHFEAVVPEVGGVASITGKHEFYFAEDDIFRNGFMLR